MMLVESDGFAPSSLTCRASVLLLNYDPGVPSMGIEPTWYWETAS